MPFADLLKKLGSLATTSVIPQAKQGYDMMADQVDPGPSLSDADHPYRAMARGGLAGLLNGFGNVADQTTSPLGLASLAAGGLAGRGIGGASRAAASTSDPLVSELAARSLPAEMMPKGGEAAYNSVRALPKMVDPQEATYARMMASKGGQLGSETGSATPGSMLGSAGAGGALLYALNKLRSMGKGDMPTSLDELNNNVNPFKGISDVLNQSR